MRVCLIAGVFALLQVWAAGGGAAQGAKRLALLIGNQAYAAEVGPLKNPHNDIGLVGAALAQAGFDLGAPLRDANREQILLAVYAFADRLKAAGPDAIGFLYYSGHGAAIDGDNMIVPVNVKSASPRELEIAGIKLSEITGVLNERAPQAAHIIVFDACRNNLGGSRGAKGFVPERQQAGTLVAFSTAPGTTASDAGGESGPYAAALAAEIAVPGRNHDDLFFEVRRRVAARTHEQQIPWTQDGLLRRVYLTPAASAQSPTAATSLGSEAAQVWAVTKDSTSRAVLEAFTARYKDTFFAELARGRLRQLDGGSAPAGGSSYDGSWHVVRKCDSCKRQLIEFGVQIEDGAIRSGSETGAVAGDGKITFQSKRADNDFVASFEGKIEGDSGQGSFTGSLPSKRWHGSGTFSMTRITRSAEHPFDGTWIANFSSTSCRLKNGTYTLSVRESVVYPWKAKIGPNGDVTYVTPSKVNHDIKVRHTLKFAAEQAKGSYQPIDHPCHGTEVLRRAGTPNAQARQ